MEASRWRSFRLASHSRRSRVDLSLLSPAFALGAARGATVVSSVGKFKAWHNGRPVADDQPLILALEPGSNDILLRVAHEAVDTAVSLSVRAAARVESTLPERLAAGSLAERLKNAGSSATDSVSAEFASVDWTKALAGGNAERGRKLFSADALGCAKCHAVLANQKGGGAPSLAGAARRFTVGHLVESILVPSKQVAPIFGTTSIVTDEGRTLAGLVVEESDERVVLLLANATRRVDRHRRDRGPQAAKHLTDAQRPGKNACRTRRLAGVPAQRQPIGSLTFLTMPFVRRIAHASHLRTFAGRRTRRDRPPGPRQQPGLPGLDARRGAGAFGAQGWPTERFEESGHGFVVRSHTIKYIEPAYVADRVVVRTWVADMTKVSSTRRYKIIRAVDESLLASAATQWAFIDFASRHAEAHSARGDCARSRWWSRKTAPIEFFTSSLAIAFGRW